MGLQTGSDLLLLGCTALRRLLHLAKMLHLMPGVFSESSCKRVNKIYEAVFLQASNKGQCKSVILGRGKRGHGASRRPLSCWSAGRERQNECLTEWWGRYWSGFRSGLFGVGSWKRGLCPGEPSQVSSSSPRPSWLQGRRKWVGRECRTDPCQMRHVNHQLFCGYEVILLAHLIWSCWGLKVHFFPISFPGKVRKVHSHHSYAIILPKCGEPHLRGIISTFSCHPSLPVGGCVRG